MMAKSRFLGLLHGAEDVSNGMLFRERWQQELIWFFGLFAIIEAKL